MKNIAIAQRGWKFGTMLSRRWKATREGKAVEATYGAEVAEAVEAAILAGRDYRRILERAERDRAARLERDAILLNPPPLHGSARWATHQEVSPLLKGREGFDNPRSLLLGSYRASEQSPDPDGFVHWDDDGHLMTLAPTRSGKARTTIIPNLLRYRGSAVVLDPKGELFTATSKWRAENVGPVYRLAPFDNGSNPATAHFPRHGYNPLAHIGMDADLLALAKLLFPRDPHASDFFSNDAAVLMQGLMAYVRAFEPPAQRNLATVIDTVFWPGSDLVAMAREMMATCGIPAAVDAAHTLLDKNKDRGLPNLLDTLRTTLRTCWKDSQIMASLTDSSVDFAALKDTPATIYIEIPFGYMQPFAPWLRVVIKSALDAMTRNPVIPEIPVLFVLDEFLQLQRFPEVIDAMRTLAGSGVRLWFFLQDVAGLEEHYPNNWKAFFTCAVRQYFGINDTFTAELIGRSLGNTTLAYLSTSTSGNVSAQNGNSRWEGGTSGVSLNSSESIQYLDRPLMNPDEVTALLANKKGEGWRESILSLAALGNRPLKASLVDYSYSPICTARIGAFTSKGISR